MCGHSAFDEPCTVHSCDGFTVTATRGTAAFLIEKEGSWIRLFEKMHGVQVVTVALRILMLTWGVILTEGRREDNGGMGMYLTHLGSHCSQHYWN